MSSVLLLSHSQYRELAEVAKREAGSILSVHKFRDKGCWGLMSWMVAGAVIDTTNPASKRIEASWISLADRINLNAFHAAYRPEIDWSAVPASRVYEFLLWHEIGHQLENFFVFDLLKAQDPSIPGKVQMINEVLADRFAWRQLFPDQPLPLRRTLSVRDQSLISTDLEYLNSIAPLKRSQRRSLPAGQYNAVPLCMLESPKLRAYVGPNANWRRNAA